jgi:hypothetical protein
MLHRIPSTIPLFIRSMGKLLRVSHIADSEASCEDLQQINRDFVKVAESKDPKRDTTVHVFSHAFDPDRTPTLAKAIPELVLRCIDELDTFVHCLLIDGQLDPQRRGQLREIVPLVQDARCLCFPSRIGATEIAEVRYSYMTEQCQGIMDLARKLANLQPTVAAGEITTLILEAQALDRKFPA